MADSGLFVPPGQSAPFSTITPTDHSAWIIISTALGLCMSLLFAVIRVFIHSATKHGYGKDDYLLAAATVSWMPIKRFATCEVLTLSLVTRERAICCACADGLGKSKDVLDSNSLSISQKV
jgi:hypothetical protein